MACCAAAIFLICQLVYGVQKVVAIVSRGRWGSERAVVADAASAWRRYPNGGMAVASVRSEARFRIPRRRTLAFAAAPVLAAALFILTKPGVPSPIPQSELLAMLHAKICGDPAAFTDSDSRTPSGTGLASVGRRPASPAPSRTPLVS